MDFLFRESLLYIPISLRQNVSTRISLRELRRLIWVDTLRRGPTSVNDLRVENKFIDFEEKCLTNQIWITCPLPRFDIYHKNLNLMPRVSDINFARKKLQLDDQNYCVFVLQKCG